MLSNEVTVENGMIRRKTEDAYEIPPLIYKGFQISQSEGEFVGLGREENKRFNSSSWEDLKQKIDNFWVEKDKEK
ncbi:MAG: hypothetical protein WCS33_04615 [Candidatus Caldatribacteriota bacterium]